AQAGSVSVRVGSVTVRSFSVCLSAQGLSACLSVQAGSLWARVGLVAVRDLPSSGRAQLQRPVSAVAVAPGLSNSFPWVRAQRGAWTSREPACRRSSDPFALLVDWRRQSPGWRVRVNCPVCPTEL